VITDALIERSKLGREQAGKIFDDSGLMGAWRPSTITVERFNWLAADRWLVPRPAMAHALWDLEIGDLGLDMASAGVGGRARRFVTVSRHDGFQLILSNDEPFERELFVHMLLRPMGSANGSGDAALRRLLEVGANVERSADRIRERVAPSLSFESGAIGELANLVAALASAVGRTVRK
jgi:hypothetical protein